MDDRHLKEEHVDGTLLFKGNFLEARRDTVRMPDGHTATREYVVHPGAVVVIPMLDDGRIVLERAADGAQASVRVSLGSASYSVKQVDTAVSVMIISTGVMLVATGEVLAFIPNELGRALLHSAKLSG